MGNYGWTILFFAILCAIFYDVLYNIAQNFHFLLVKSDALMSISPFGDKISTICKHPAFGLTNFAEC